MSDSTVNGQLQIVKHANGRDWWLVQPMAWSNGYYTFLITGDTILLTHKQYIGYPSISGNSTWLGQSVFSPDGSKYARYDWKNDLDILDFDRCSGLFSNPIHIPIQDTFDILGGGTFTGVAISPSSQYLYVCSFHLLYQYDLWASNIATSKDTVAVHNGYVGPIGFPTIFRCLKLAPDNKIYIMSENYNLHTIESPDLGGISCDVQQHSVTVPYLLLPFIPNFPHYRTPALAGSPCDTLTSTVAVDIGRNWEVILYPNPTDNELTLESSLVFEKNASIEIFNALGQLIKTKLVTAETNNVTIDASSLLDGIYIMRLKNGESIVTKSFIVSK